MQRYACARRIPAELYPVIRNGIGSQIMDSLTTGVVLVGFALHLGATHLAVGIIGAIPFLTALFQLPAIWLVERLRDRKRIVVVTSLIGRVAIASVFLVPWIGDRDAALVLLLTAVTARYIVGAICNCAWNSWMRDIIPPDLLGTFVGYRLQLMSLAAVFAGVAVALAVDRLGGHDGSHLTGFYAGIYLLASAFGLWGTLQARRIPDAPLSAAELGHYERDLTRAKLLAPFYNHNFRRVIVFLSSWQFAVNLAAPFFAFYMLTTLGYDMTFVMLVTLYSQLLTAFAYTVWGRYVDHFSHKAVMSVCGWMFGLCLPLWTFTSMPTPHALTTPLVLFIHTFMGIASAGLNLTINGLALKLAPPAAAATGYLAMNSLVSSLAAGVAPLISGSLADYFAGRQLSLQLVWRSPDTSLAIQTVSLTHWDFIFVLSFGFVLYALHRLSMIVEEGREPEAGLLRELMLDTSRVVRTYTTVDGLRDLVTAPFVLIGALVKRRGR